MSDDGTFHRLSDESITDLLASIDGVLVMSDLSERERDLTYLLRSLLHEVRGWRWLGEPTYAPANVLDDAEWLQP